MSPLLSVYLAQGLVLTIVITRIAYKTKEPYEGPGDSLWLGMLISFLWPVGILVFAVIGTPAAILHVLGKIVTFKA